MRWLEVLHTADDAHDAQDASFEQHSYWLMLMILSLVGAGVGGSRG